jgi:hypothetical protein
MAPRLDRSQGWPRSFTSKLTQMMVSGFPHHRETDEVLSATVAVDADHSCRLQATPRPSESKTISCRVFFLPFELEVVPRLAGRKFRSRHQSFDVAFATSFAFLNPIQLLYRHLSEYIAVPSVEPDVLSRGGLLELQLRC